MAEYNLNNIDGVIPTLNDIYPYSEFEEKEFEFIDKIIKFLNCSKEDIFILNDIDGVECQSDYNEFIEKYLTPSKTYEKDEMECNFTNIIEFNLNKEGYAYVFQKEYFNINTFYVPKYLYDAFINKKEDK